MVMSRRAGTCILSAILAGLVVGLVATQGFRTIAVVTGLLVFLSCLGLALRNYTAFLELVILLFVPLGTFAAYRVGNFGISLGNVLLTLAACVALATVFLRRIRPTFSSIEVFGFLTILSIALFLVIGVCIEGNDPKYVLLDLNQWSYFILSLLVFGVMRNFVRPDLAVLLYDRAAWWVFISNVLLSATGLVGALAGRYYIDLGRLDPVGLGTTFPGQDRGLVRIMYGAQAMLFLPVTYWFGKLLADRHGSWTRKAALALLIGLSALMLVANGSRAYILSLGCSMVLLAVLLRPIPGVLALFIGFPVLFLLARRILDFNVVRSFSQLIEGGQTFRMAEVRSVLECIADSYLLGKGIGASYSFYVPTIDFHSTWFLPHVSFLYLPLKFGVFGSIPFVLYWLVSLRRAVAVARTLHWFSSSVRIVTLSVIATSVGLLISSLSAPVLFAAHGLFLQAYMFATISTIVARDTSTDSSGRTRSVVTELPRGG